MDRLVVGDVGYGKTEVALRAAALAALAGKQVAIAAPTTVLVRQHLETFSRRFEGTGIDGRRPVAPVDRRREEGGQGRARRRLDPDRHRHRRGDAARASTYANLGLVVIDEEQRFGAADKAKLRGDRPSVHLLTLSATPIPRTLQMALVGLQQMSVIATPPARRQPIRTSARRVRRRRDPHRAAARERRAAGRASSSSRGSRTWRRWPSSCAASCPTSTSSRRTARCRPPRSTTAMVDFADGDGDVLLATNIIEAGLDVPRANTMIVWRADRFGLAQLHQLRGRVGRGSRRGQVILLTEPDAPRSANATLKRLRTLATFDRLGAGFAISARDLDMRGAGDLLGETQAGHMKLIGVDLYQHLLGRRAARGARRGGRALDARTEPRHRRPPARRLDSGGRPAPRPLRPPRPAHGRRRRSMRSRRNWSTASARCPPPAEALLTRARIGLLARAARIARIDAGPAAIALTPGEDFTGDTEALGLESRNGRLLLKQPGEGERAAQVLQLLEALTD